MIRFVVIVIFLVIFLILSLPIFPILLLIGLFSREKRDRISYAIVSKAFGVILVIAGTKIELKGMENIPRNQPVLFVGNHRSMFDIAINYNRLPACMGFIAKKEMKKAPILNWWMILMNCLFLDRENIKEGLKTIIAGTENLKNGISMFVFPEGTRSRNESEMLEFKEGSLKMAEKSGRLIVPVAITNTSACFEDHFPKVKKANVIVEYCEPVNINEMSKEDKKHAGAIIRELIQEKVNKNRELIQK